MTKILHVTPTEVRAARLAVELAEGAGGEVEEGLRRIANVGRERTERVGTEPSVFTQGEVAPVSYEAPRGEGSVAASEDPRSIYSELVVDALTHLVDDLHRNDEMKWVRHSNRDLLVIRAALMSLPPSSEVRDALANLSEASMWGDGGRGAMPETDVRGQKQSS